MLSQDDQSRVTIHKWLLHSPVVTRLLRIDGSTCIFFSVVPTRSFAGATLVGGANPISVAVTYA